jgi:hypothetical protein
LTLLCLVELGPAAQAAPRRREAEPHGIGIQLLEGPVSRKDDPRAKHYVVDHLKPGTTIRRKIQIANRSRERQSIHVYPAAATLAEEEFVFGEGHTGNELTSWFSVDKNQLNLGPGATAVIRLTVVVPPDTSPGERYAVVWASAVRASEPTRSVTLASRVGIRVYLDIGAGGEPASDFTISALTPARSVAGEPSLSATVTNTGGRALDMTGSANLTDGPASQRAGPFPVTKNATLAPGATGTIVVQFPPALPNGPWKVELKLSSGMVHHSVTAGITFPDPGHVGKPGTVLTWVSNPWVITGGLLALGLIVLVPLGLVARRSRRSQPVK